MRGKWRLQWNSCSPAALPLKHLKFHLVLLILGKVKAQQGRALTFTAQGHYSQKISSCSGCWGWWADKQEDIWLLLFNRLKIKPGVTWTPPCFFKNGGRYLASISLEEDEQMERQKGRGKLLASFMMSHQALSSDNYWAGNEDRTEALICCLWRTKEIPSFPFIYFFSSHRSGQTNSFFNNEICLDVPKIGCLLLGRGGQLMAGSFSLSPAPHSKDSLPWQMFWRLPDQILCKEI